MSKDAVAFHNGFVVTAARPFFVHAHSTLKDPPPGKSAGALTSSSFEYTGIAKNVSLIVIEVSPSKKNPNGCYKKRSKLLTSTSSLRLGTSH